MRSGVVGVTDRPADVDDMEHRRRLSGYVESALSRNEQEFGLSGFGDGDTFKFFTYSPTQVRSLLEHSHADIEWLYIIRDGTPVGKVSDPLDVRPVDDGDRVEGICVRMPLGVWSIKGTPRKRDTLSTVVNTPDDVEKARESFATGAADE